MDRIVEVRVRGNHISKDNKYAGVRGEANVTNLKISFDAGWDYYSKAVVFFDARGNNPVKRIQGVDLIEDITKDKRTYITPIPKEPMAIAGELTFVIEGYKGDKIQKSVSDKLVVRDSPDTQNAGEPEAPTPDQISQLQGEIDNIIDTIEKAVEAKDTANLALDYLNKAQTAVSKTAKIGDNGNWYAWDSVKGEFYDTGVKAQAGSTVYYGENPPPEADVWITPDGEEMPIKSNEVEVAEGVSLKTELESINRHLTDNDNKILGRPTYREAEAMTYEWAKQPKKPKYTVDEVEMIEGVPLSEEIASINRHLNDNDGSIANKVDKVDGKGLSTNDFTDAEKAKLAGFKDADYYASENSVNSVEDRTTELENAKQMLRNDVDDIYESLNQYQYRDDNNLETEAKEIVPAINELYRKQPKETVLYEGVVEAEIWTNQPMVLVDGFPSDFWYNLTELEEGLSEFNTSDFYYVTLKDASGNALPSGQFMLKHFYSDTVPIDVLFDLNGLKTGLNTGIKTLKENAVVEFVEDGSFWKMREAGFENNWFDLYRTLDKNFGKIKIESVGSIIPTSLNAVPLLLGYLSKNISNFHGGHHSSYQLDSSPYFGMYLALTIGNSVYKTARVCDCFTIESMDDQTMLTERKASVVHKQYDTTNHTDTNTCKVSSQHAMGAGIILSENTVLKQLNCAALNGYVKNGTRIRITEVK